LGGGLTWIKAGPGILVRVGIIQERSCLMPPDTVRVTEDAFHRLQTPRPALLTDEDIENAAEVAIWNCDPDLRDRVCVSARQGVLTLTGAVESDAQRAAVVQAVRDLDRDIAQVVDELDVVLAAPTEAGPAPEASGRREIDSEPMLYVTRYCGTEPSSIAAALNDAVEVLDRRFEALGLARPETAIVVYRNRLPESLTIDVGYVLPARPALPPEVELKAGNTAAGPMLSLPSPPGFRGVLGALDRLTDEASRQGLSPGDCAWQRIPYSALRIQPVHLSGLLYLPVG
jgi:hypothetical protein